MKIAICATNFVGYKLSSFVAKQGHPIEFAMTGKNDSYEERIYDIFSKNNIECHRSMDINSKEFVNLLKKNNIDLVFLLWWPKIVKKDVIQSANIGFVNLHPSLLPYNRGKHPYYWSIVDHTPAGVSIHFITEGIDDGALLCQKHIKTDITTTGEDLYLGSIKEIMSLFKENYRAIIENSLQRRKQNINEGTFHLEKEIENHSEIDLDKNYRAFELLDIMRARSFPGRPSSFFYLNKEKYYVNIMITKVANNEF